VVPPGSREALSSGPNNPASGFGETTLGDVAQSDPVRLPDLATVFSTRAERLRALATGHELEGFLRMVAALVAAQHEALTDLPPGSLPGPAEIAKARLVQRSPLDPVTWPRDESWRVALQRLLDNIDDSVLPEPARAARTALAAADPAHLEALADRFLDATDLGSGEADSGQCPACGSPPVAGVISPGGTKFGHRHLHCSLCATAWRYARVRCVHCGSTDKISFRQFAGTSYLRAECCEQCHGYSKVFYLEKARAIEALADDLASLGLDVLVGEEGFSRVSNPFVLGVMEPSGD
jgi:FdhE protein